MDANCMRRVLVGTMIVLFVVISTVTRANYGLLRKSEKPNKPKVLPPWPNYHTRLPPPTRSYHTGGFLKCVWRHKCLRKEIFEEKMGCCVECLEQ